MLAQVRRHFLPHTSRFVHVLHQPFLNMVAEVHFLGSEFLWPLLSVYMASTVYYIEHNIYFLFNFFKVCIYLAVPGLSCGMQDLF